ncbi:MAG: tRNA (adenosine(37)-N6)-threonylcarbamoyltransferase complex dimerization subunit type 1 TsaB [Myxococcales bacterium]|nr:tRNA (adenosine(37)-N6)-threonylcarbamoyltransferase complex dimerization subunit type 1 TsaB [Myxococcales bacterium]MDH3484659.1 tRNA (adenosine(37)-N6)-threonylcarbamoyltransferase complex dimerization subunit type 1 TsaB [Myxococcales bacterium]
MTTLCIDTATDVGTVAIARNGAVAAAVTWRSSSRHGENLFGHIDAALKHARVARSEIALVGVDIGPGKFTSLRVGLSTAKGIAFGLGLPIVGVSSLRVLARSVTADDEVARVALMNAYRGDLFAAAYLLGNGVEQDLVPPTFGPPEEVLPRIHDAIGKRRIALCGEGAKTQAAAVEAFLGSGTGDWSEPLEAPSASAIAWEIEHVMRTRGPDDLASLEPQYLRPSDAKLPQRALHVSTRS